MIVDASAMLAILLDEPDARKFSDAIGLCEGARIPAPNWLEVAMKIESMTALAGSGQNFADSILAFYMARKLIQIEPYTEEHSSLARVAFRRFGKGRHPAGLNFGDCIAYSVAKFENAPLLFKGNDFIHTDIEPALKS
ncbi:MAG: type II toxin-antitoxin system VapC family toxin [Acetobacteraceae bacterium]|nr:type II toxin-antitoxin system VapC family toxin [Acetobacteraceae bacterium]